MNRLLLQIVAGTCCLAAAIISYSLLEKHIAGSSGQTWFEVGCSEEVGAGRANCAAVLATPYSYFPTMRPNEPSERWHVPVAFLGLLYYSALLIWVVGVGPPSRERRWTLAIPLLLVEFGVPASIFYTAIMFLRLEEWCPWCLVTHVLNVVTAVCVALMWPRAVVSESTSGQHDTSIPRPVSTSKPSVRAVVLTTLMIGIVSCGHVSVLKLLTCQQDKETAVGNYEACYRSIKRLKRTPAKLYGMWQATQKCELTIRPDDPVRIRTEDTSEQPFFDIVVFSDFGCPSCARFAELLDRSIGRLFADRVRVTYKHYPLDRTCNRDRTCRGGAPQTLHPYACDAARMAEAARRLEGNEGFWRAHDFLHENRERLARGELDPGQFAGELGIDPRALREAVDSQIVASRVEQDVSQAKGCGVFATPSVFIEGKLVDPLEVMEIGFWNEMAERYWNEIGEPRPESTKLPGIRLIRR